MNEKNPTAESYNLGDLYFPPLPEYDKTKFRELSGWHFGERGRIIYNGPVGVCAVIATTAINDEYRISSDDLNWLQYGTPVIRNKPAGTTPFRNAEQVYAWRDGTLPNPGYVDKPEGIRLLKILDRIDYIYLALLGCVLDDYKKSKSAGLPTSTFINQSGKYGICIDSYNWMGRHILYDRHPSEVMNNVRETLIGCIIRDSYGPLFQIIDEAVEGYQLVGDELLGLSDSGGWYKTLLRLRGKMGLVLT